MKLNIEFATTKLEHEWKKETIDYFQFQGFKLSLDKPDKLQFKRGSLLQNSFTFNPLKWKSEIDISLDKDHVTAKFNINTTFQLSTAKEEAVWNGFIENYKESILTGKSFENENQTLQNENQKFSMQLLWFGILGAISFGIPAGLISFYTNNPMLVALGSALGFITFVFFKLNKNRLT